MCTLLSRPVSLELGQCLPGKQGLTCRSRVRGSPDPVSASAPPGVFIFHLPAGGQLQFHWGPRSWNRLEGQRAREGRGGKRSVQARLQGLTPWVCRFFFASPGRVPKAD